MVTESELGSEIKTVRRVCTQKAMAINYENNLQKKTHFNECIREWTFKWVEVQKIIAIIRPLIYSDVTIRHKKSINQK